MKKKKIDIWDLNAVQSSNFSEYINLKVYSRLKIRHEIV